MTQHQSRSRSQPQSVEDAIKRAAEWLHKGAPKDEAEAVIRDVVNHGLSVTRIAPTDFKAVESEIERRKGPADRRANDPQAPNAPYRRMSAGRRAGDAERRQALVSAALPTIPVDWNMVANAKEAEKAGMSHITISVPIKDILYATPPMSAPSATVAHVLTPQDQAQIKDAHASTASAGEWMVRAMDEGRDHGDHFHIIHRLTHSIRDLLRVIASAPGTTVRRLGDNSWLLPDGTHYKGDPWAKGGPLGATDSGRNNA